MNHETQLSPGAVQQVDQPPMERAPDVRENNQITKPILEEFGILDHMEKAEKSLADSISAASRIGPLIEEIAEEVNRQTAIFEQSVGLPASQKKTIVNAFASFLKEKAVELKQAASSARESFDTFADSTILGASLEKETVDKERYEKDIAEFLHGAESVLPTFALARNATVSFISIAQNLPRITIQFNQAKRELLAAAGECVNFFENAEGRIFEITART
jgi:hypothetical protein